MTADPVRVAIAGSTGSIGSQTFEVIQAENDRTPGSYVVTGVSANSSADAVIAQAAAFDIPLIVIADETTRSDVASRTSAAVEGDVVHVDQQQVEVLAGVVLL